MRASLEDTSASVLTRRFFHTHRLSVAPSKYSCIRLVVALVLSGIGIFGVTHLATASPITLGDLAPRGQPDGSLNAADLLILHRIVFGAIQPTTDELIRGDVAPLGVPDGLLNAADLLILQRAVLGQIVLPAPSDTDSPMPVDITLVTISQPSSDTAQVMGSAGSAEPGTVLMLENFETGARSTISVSADGSFVANISAISGQVLAIHLQDDAGNISEIVSAGVGTVVTIAIDTPIQASNFSDNRVTVTGTVSGPENTGVIVNGVVACVYGSQFYAVDVPVISGTNTLTATATVLDGVTATDSVQITATGPATFQLFSSNNCGITPQEVYFNIADNAGIGIQSISVDADANGSAEYSGPPLSDGYSFTFVAAGVYHPVVTVTDSNGGSSQLIGTIVVSDPALINSLLTITYDGLTARLRTGAVTGAINHFSATTSDTYAAIFNDLGDDLPTVTDSLGSLSPSTLGDGWAEFLISRPGAGGTEGFLIYFIQGEDGVWRLESM